MSATSSIACTNEIRVALVRGRSRLVRCQCASPLKLLNPESHASCCHVSMSSFGGGLVQGDAIRLSIACKQQASLYLDTQAHTRIYDSRPDVLSRQALKGTLEAASFAFVDPHPVVPHAGSRFRQTQEWDVAESANLVLADWFHSGRQGLGESFAYNLYESRVRIRRDGNLLLSDTIRSQPNLLDPTVEARFGPFHTLLSIYLLGERCTRIAEEVLESLVTEPVPPVGDRVCSLQPFAGEGMVFRALMRNTGDGADVLRSLTDALCRDGLLTFNPRARKL